MTVGSVVTPGRNSLGSALALTTAGSGCYIRVDEPCGILGKIGVLRKNHRYWVTDVSYAIPSQDRLPKRIHAGRPRRAQRYRLDLREVVRNPDGDHPGGCKCCAYVNVSQNAVGDRRAHHSHGKLAGEVDIVSERTFAAHEGRILQTWHWSSEDTTRSRRQWRCRFAAFD